MGDYGAVDSVGGLKGAEGLCRHGVYVCPSPWLHKICSCECGGIVRGEKEKKEK